MARRNLARIDDHDISMASNRIIIGDGLVLVVSQHGASCGVHCRARKPLPGCMSATSDLRRAAVQTLPLLRVKYFGHR